MISIQSQRLLQTSVHTKLGDLLSFEINPNRISKTILKEFFVGNDWLQNRAFFDWFIVGGDWDVKTGLFRQERNFKEILDLFDHGKYFRDSFSYKKCVLEWQRGIPQKDYRGNHFREIQDIDDTFSYYLGLIESMKENGYVPQEFLNKTGQERDIGVAISSSAEPFHFRTGHHRLAIAQILQLPSIRVHVHFVHHNWIASGAKSQSSDLDRDKLEIIREKIRAIDDTTTG